MRKRLPPHNQRRINARLAVIYPGKYASWREYALELQCNGCTYAEIATCFGELGVPVSLYTVRDWMLERDAESVAA